MDLRPMYFDALDRTAGLVEGVKSDQLSNPTPCGDWDTRALLNHFVGGVFMFARAVEGQPADPTATPPDFTKGDLAAAMKDARTAAEQAWNQQDALERDVTILAGPMPSNVALRIALGEVVVHGWDIARATGQAYETNDMIATAMLNGFRQMLGDSAESRKNFFGPPVEPPADATALEQLVAYMGRDPR